MSHPADNTLSDVNHQRQHQTHPGTHQGNHPGTRTYPKTRPRTHPGTHPRTNPRHPLIAMAPCSVTRLTCLALMSEVFSLIPFIVAYAAPYWMRVSDPMGLTYSGLWRLCAYTNCEYFAGHPMYTWFHTVQVCSSLALVCQLFSFIVTCVYTFPSACHRFKLHLLWSAGTALIIADVFQLSSVVLYGVYQGADQGTLSWAFILAVLCTGFTILPIIFLAFEASRLLHRKTKKHLVLHRSVSEASIITNVPKNHPVSSKQSNQETSNDPTNIPRNGLVRMRVNSCSTLLNDTTDLASCNDTIALDNSVFD